FIATGPGFARLTAEILCTGTGSDTITGGSSTMGAGGCAVSGTDTIFEISKSEITSCTTARSTTFCFSAQASDNALKQKLFTLRGIPSVNVPMISNASAAN